MATADIPLLNPSVPCAGSSRFVAWIVVTLVAALLFLPRLGDRDLTSSHEARAAQNAQTMLNTGDWLLPRLYDGHVELQKPPLYYWLVAGLGWLRGGHVDVWCVRLPAAASALGCVLFLHFLGRATGRPLTGLLAALILASCVHFTWLARVGRIDMPLTFCVTVALGSFFLGHRRSQLGQASRPWRLAGYTAIGMGVLLKGPIAAVLPALVVLAALLVLRVPWSPRRSSLWWGVPWIALIAGPWFVLANAETGGALWRTFFLYHNVDRALGGSDALASYPWWFYGPRASVDLLPWSLVAPVAFVWMLRRNVNTAARLGLAWFLVTFAFLSCVSFKRADYLLPAYPGFALFLGAVGESWWREQAERRQRNAAFAWVLTLIGCVAAWWGYHSWIAPRDEAGEPYRQLARDLRSVPGVPVIFFRAESHALMFHLGQPVGTILEWENLAIWAGEPFPVLFVMPEDAAEEWAAHLPPGALVEWMRTRNTFGGHDRPLVVLRNRGESGSRP